MGPPYAVLNIEKKTVLYFTLKNERSALYLFEWKARFLLPINHPFVSISSIHALDDNTLVFQGKSTRTQSAIIRLTISDPSVTHSGVTQETLKSSIESIPFPDSIISQPELLALGTESERVRATVPANELCI